MEEEGKRAKGGENKKIKKIKKIKGNKRKYIFKYMTYTQSEGRASHTRSRTCRRDA